jgi:hypothetical protein
MRRSTPPEALFIDTWGWLALADARDPAHAKAVSERRARRERGSLITSDYVLDETFTRLFSRMPFLLPAPVDNSGSNGLRWSDSTPRTSYVFATATSRGFLSPI